MNWTDESITQLTNLWNEGKTGNEIAVIMGISRNSVIGKAHRLGLSGRPSPIKRDKNTDHGVNLLLITERMCRWPIGDPKKPGFYCCGDQIDYSQIYCAKHRAMAYQPTKKHIPLSR